MSRVNAKDISPHGGLARPRPKVGIPKALLYYQYIPLWKRFFEELGAEVVISANTNKAIVDQGIKQTVDETCFPVKVYFGHLLTLAGQVDYLFLPRLVSVEAKAYICPKFLGLPDMVRSSIKNLPKLLSPDINLHKNEQQLYKSVWEVGKEFTAQPWKVYRAYHKAYAEYLEYQQLLLTGMSPEVALTHLWKNGPKSISSPWATNNGLTIAVISHPYNLYDDQINMGVLVRLQQMGVKVLTPENVPPETIKLQTAKLNKQLFWSMGRKLVGAAFFYLECPEVDGIIHLAAFGCGPDSFTGELIEREIRRKSSKYYLNLTIDEHTGEAGVVTRLEAFIDMMQRRVARCE